MCGATSAQNNVLQTQQAALAQAGQQARTIFGNNEAAYNDLVGTFAPTIAAGPGQQGFSPTELSNMNSQLITNVGQGYNNAKQSVGNAQAAAGGGTSVLPGGANIATNDSLAENAANATSSGLANITQQNYAQGNQNYWNAAAGLAGASNVFNTGTSAINAETGAGSAAASSANDIAQAANSPWQAAIGAAGAVAGAAAGNTALFGGGSNSSQKGGN